MLIFVSVPMDLAFAFFFEPRPAQVPILDDSVWLASTTIGKPTNERRCVKPTDEQNVARLALPALQKRRNGKPID